MSSKAEALARYLRDGYLYHRLPLHSRKSRRPLEVGTTVEGDLVIRDMTEELELMCIPAGSWTGEQHAALFELVGVYNAAHRLALEEP